MECPTGLRDKAHGHSVENAGLEALVLTTYLLSILLLVAGPSHILAQCFRRPPWYTDKAVYAPLFGLLFLVVASVCYDRKSIIDGPMIADVLDSKFSIILLILSFAYLSISLDISGYFKVSALGMIRAARGDGVRLLIYLYLMCSFLTYFTSNDIVIISMTPIVVHTCTVGIHDCVPLLITQFIAANTASMGLLLGSPSNVILGDAVGLSFLRYLVLMMLPTVVAIATTLVMVLVVFVWAPTRGHAMQRRFTTPHDVEDHLAGMELPTTSPPASTAAAPSSSVSSPPPSAAALEASPAAAAAPPPRRSESTEAEQEVEDLQEHSLLINPRVRRFKVVAFFSVLLLLSIADYIHASLWSVSLAAALAMLTADLILVHRDGKSPLSYLRVVHHRMPWAIAPFVVCMFLLVQALSRTGFTDCFARWMISAAGSSFFSQSLVFGFVSALLVNVLNDLPSTVFWSLMTPTLCSAYGTRQYTGVIMALLVGVNPGCYLTIIGALAGLMWRNIICTQPGVSKLVIPSAWDLTYYGALVLGPVTFLTCASVSIIAPLV